MPVRALFQPTILLALALMAVICVMVLPMPAWALDIGLALSFALAILIFTITLFIQRPLDFSAFPTVLLGALMLRLALNVASTKLIIGQGHTGTDAAGGVIEGFAHFIMGGNLFLGLVVFLVLMIVNFVVITKGAGRMAEVGARFALDAMPGKQLAIDSDVAAGALSHEEATARRKIEQEETTFYGSLDGASKFVKGDAIAGLLITLLNLVMGLAMGTLVHGLSVGSAVETYAVLTVGDGLVSQIPSVITSIGAALLLSKGGVVGTADRAMVAQLGGYPAALATVAALMALFALMPGLPAVPFLAGAMALGGAAWTAARHAAEAPVPVAEVPEAETGVAARERALGDLIDVDEVHVRFHPSIVGAMIDSAAGLDARIANLRRHVASEFGIVLPEIRLTDDPLLAQGHYAILVQGTEAARARLEPGHVLVLHREGASLSLEGADVQEPVYKAPARWVPARLHDDAAAGGFTVITPAEVVATHLLETVKNNLGRLFTRRALRRLLDAFAKPSDPARAEANAKLIDDFIPDRVPPEALQAVLRQLLDEQVPVRNLPLLLEAVAEAHSAALDPEASLDHVRRRLAFIITARLAGADGKVPLVRLGEGWVAMMGGAPGHGGASAGPSAASNGADDPGPGGTVGTTLHPGRFAELADAVANAIAAPARQGVVAVLAVPARWRRVVREVLLARGITNPVLALEEIGLRTPVALLGTVADPT
ncbi:MAG: flagellar biosynthesis protein FlhA [Pseudomonadota bacterium]